MNDFLKFMGVQTVLTREDDRSLHGESAKSIRQQKREDLVYRLTFTMEQKRPIYVGIHQNFFKNLSSRGTQTFYSQNHEGSKALATVMQHTVVSLLQKENKRVPSKSPPGVFLLKQLTCPAVIVECGFLSNPEEEMLLISPDYQNKMAYTLAAGILSLTEEVFIE
jgi:N-acetylmuramoyl-L-alanine amidase